MAVRMCPECKQVIPEGKIRGDSKTCTACFRRTSPADLIVLDGNGNPASVSSQEVAEQPEKPVSLSQNKQDESNADLFVNVPNQVPKDIEKEQPQVSGTGNQSQSFEQDLAGSDPNFLQAVERMRQFGVCDNMIADHLQRAALISGQIDERFPDPMPLDEIQLPEGAIWEANSNWGDGFGRPTLVFRANGSALQIFFGVVWTFFSMIFVVSWVNDLIKHWGEDSFELGGTLGSLVFVCIFVAIGIGCLYFGVRNKFSRTWIEVDKDYLLITQGLSKKGKQIKLERNVEHIAVNMSVSCTVNRIPMFKVEMCDKTQTDKKIRLANDAPYESALRIYNMAKALVVAEV